MQNANANALEQKVIELDKVREEVVNRMKETWSITHVVADYDEAEIIPGFLIKRSGLVWSARDAKGREYDGYKFKDFIVLQQKNNKENIFVFTWDGKPKEFVRNGDTIIIDRGGFEVIFRI